MTKDEIRSQIKAIRRTLTAEEIDKKSAAAINFITALPQYRTARTVMAYLSAFREVDTSKLIQDICQSKRLVVPVSNTDTFTITPSYLQSPDELIKGAYGISEPKIVRPTKISDIDIAIIPGIAFDRQGGRIGFGKGYYDRFLAEFKGTKIGLCYEFQLTGKLPLSSHDIRMDAIITEKRVYNDF